MNRAITTFAIALSFTTASSVLPSKDANAAGTEIHELRYDPDACKTDAQGKVYIAVGRSVFAFATTGAVITAEYGNPTPKAPDLSDAPGCPANPAQLSSYSFPYTYDAPAEKTGSGFPNAPQVDVLQLMSIPGSTELLLSDDLDEHGASFDVKRPPSGCVIRKEPISGFTVCGMQPGAGDTQATYIARPETYQTPLGQPFVVKCSDQADKNPAGRCDVDYMFAPGLGVNYQFHTAQDSKVLPIDQVIAFDRGLRAAITATMVKNYHWAD